MQSLSNWFASPGKYFVLTASWTVWLLGVICGILVPTVLSQSKYHVHVIFTCAEPFL